MQFSFSCMSSTSRNKTVQIFGRSAGSSQQAPLWNRNVVQQKPKKLLFPAFSQMARKIRQTMQVLVVDDARGIEKILLSHVWAPLRSKVKSLKKVTFF